MHCVKLAVKCMLAEVEQFMHGGIVVWCQCHRSTTGFHFLQETLLLGLPAAADVHDSSVLE